MITLKEAVVGVAITALRSPDDYSEQRQLELLEAASRLLMAQVGLTGLRNSVDQKILELKEKR